MSTTDSTPPTEGARPTYRERRMARADRLDSWADGREARASAARTASDAAVAGIPMGQPILVGHHSEARHRRALDRSDRQMRRSVEDASKAVSMRSRAAGIRAAAQNAIYSDDPDARERLTEKLETLTARREAMKTRNAAFRKKHRAELAAMTPFGRNRAVPHPSYEIQNIGGVISTTRKRLAALGGPVAPDAPQGEGI